MTHEAYRADAGRVPAGPGAGELVTRVQPALFGDDSGELRRDGGEPRREAGAREVVGQVIVFVVPGTPVGKGRPKFARRGNFVTTYTPEKTASYENLVKIAAGRAMSGRAPIDGAVAVSLSIYVTPPASWSQKKQRAALSGEIYPTTKPDIDNVEKAVFDAMNEIVWKDDKQVVDVDKKKRYAIKAEVVVQVRAL